MINMNKYRFCCGLAIFPEHDMKMLSRMSSSGWHLKSFSGLMYSFERGEPEHYIYSVNLEKSVNDDMLSLYRESGWNPVIAQNGYQIFRAERGTPPIFSDKESEIQMLKNNRFTAGKLSLISFLAIVLFVFLLVFTDISDIVFLSLLLIAWVCFVFSFFPFVGFCFKIIKLNREC